MHELLVKSTASVANDKYFQGRPCSFLALNSIPYLTASHVATLRMPFIWGHNEQDLQLRAVPTRLAARLHRCKHRALLDIQILWSVEAKWSLGRKIQPRPPCDCCHARWNERGRKCLGWVQCRLFGGVRYNQPFYNPFMQFAVYHLHKYAGPA